MERGDDGFVRHRCTCTRRVVLGSYGHDDKGKIVYKVLWRDRVMIVYFGAFLLRCPACQRWTRIRMLPREKKAQITPMGTNIDREEKTAARFEQL